MCGPDSPSSSRALPASQMDGYVTVTRQTSTPVQRPIRTLEIHVQHLFHQTRTGAGAAAIMENRTRPIAIAKRRIMLASHLGEGLSLVGSRLGVQRWSSLDNGIVRILQHELHPPTAPGPGLANASPQKLTCAKQDFSRRPKRCGRSRGPADLRSGNLVQPACFRGYLRCAGQPSSRCRRHCEHRAGSG